LVEPASLCKLLAESDDSIIITTLLDDNVAKDWFVKQGTLVPDQKSSQIMATQASLLCSLVNTNHDYLGKLYHIIVRQELADVMLFPITKKQVLIVLVRRPYNSDKMIELLNKFIKRYLE
jgi:hypothetical protein